MDELHDLAQTFAIFADCAAQLEGWYDGGCRGARPPGRLRPVDDGTLTWCTRAWTMPLYRLLYDPDGRPVKVRMRHSF